MCSVMYTVKAMLHEAIFLATCNTTMTNKDLSSCRGGVTRLQLFSQLATCTKTNKMADSLSRWHLAKDELWLAHSDKIALQVAEGIHASNLSHNVAKGRGSFYFSCNSQRNNCSWGVTHEFFLATCNATFVALQVARKIASCNMAISF